MQNTQRYVIFSFLAAGILLWATIAKLLSAITLAADISDPPILGSQFTLTTLLGMIIAIIAGFLTYKNERVHTFSGEVASELRKCTWPERKETRTATVVVIVTTIIIALILGMFDIVWAKITGLIYT